MSSNKFYIMMGAFAALMMVSCSKNEGIEVINDGKVRFKAEIDNMATPKSRASNVDWAEGDAIGVFMVDLGTTDISMSAENVKYTTTGDGLFVTDEANAIEFPNEGKVSFISYYPWVESQTLGNYNIEIPTVQTTENQPEFDLLYASATNKGAGYDRIGQNKFVGLKFDHKLHKLVLNCKVDHGLGISIDGITATIKGMFTQNTFDLSTGSMVLENATNVQQIIPRSIAPAEGYEYAFDAIVLPRPRINRGEVDVEFRLPDGTYFNWIPLTGTAFLAGIEYTIYLTMTRNGPIMDKVNIQPWTSNTITGEVEKVKN